MWAPSWYPLMQKNSHPTTGPMLPASAMTPSTAYEVLSNFFTLYSNGEWFKEYVSNRSPGTPFPSIICYSFSLFPPCLFSYKHPSRGLKALSYLKYVNTCQIWTLSIWECFSSLGRKHCNDNVGVILKSVPIVVLRHCVYPMVDMIC